MAAMPRKESAHAGRMEPDTRLSKEASDRPEISDFPLAAVDRMLTEEAQLIELQNRIRRLSRLMLEGRGMSALMDAIERELGNPVAIVREQEKPLLSAGLRADAAPETWPLAQTLDFRPAGRNAGGFLALTPATRAYACPIQGRGDRPSVFVLVERHRELSAFDAISAERLSSLAGLELANEEAVREVESKYTDQFLQDWLTGRIVAESDWRLRADVCGCEVPDESPLCAVLVGFGEGREKPDADALREWARKLRKERAEGRDGVLSVAIGGDLALIVPLPEPARADKQGEPGETLQRLVVELRQLFGDPELRLFAGRPTDRPEALPASLSQARRARQVAEVCGMTGDTVAYDRLGAYSLLYLIPACEEREQFLQRFAAPLRKADRRGGGRLVETLEMFFRCNGNIKLTSEKLYAHYNTVVYRLDKVQSILGISLHDPEDRLQLELSLRLGRITPGSPQPG